MCNWLTRSDLDRVVGCLDDAFQQCQSAALNLLRIVISSQFDCYCNLDVKLFLDETLRNMCEQRSRLIFGCVYRIRLYLHLMPTQSQHLLALLMDELDRRSTAIGESILNIADKDGAVHGVLSVLVAVLQQHVSIFERNK